jgi:hypothetical protein
VSFTKTPTPPYRGQSNSSTPAPATNWLAWLTSLFRTSTPAYKTKLMHGKKAENRERSQ